MDEEDEVHLRKITIMRTGVSFTLNNVYFY